MVEVKVPGARGVTFDGRLNIPVYRLPLLDIVPGQSKVVAKGKEVQLRPTEAHFLQSLAAHGEEGVDHKTLFAEAWDEPYDSETSGNRIRVYTKKVRTKLSQLDNSSEMDGLIVTKRGERIRLRDEVRKVQLTVAPLSGKIGAEEVDEERQLMSQRPGLLTVFNEFPNLVFPYAILIEQILGKKQVDASAMRVLHVTIHRLQNAQVNNVVDLGYAYNDPNKDSLATHLSRLK